ncbi:hypothetical protein Tco_1287924 [Tanacetum coccineum]
MTLRANGALENGLRHSYVAFGIVIATTPASNLRRIQVKDIVKEVEDYLKTYSSAGMDISWQDKVAFELKPEPKYEFMKDCEQLQNCSQKYGQDVSKNGRALNAFNYGVLGED